MHDALDTRMICTARGVAVDPLRTDLGNVSLEDVAHALCVVPRFVGQTTQIYSAAEHSVWLSRHVPAEHAMAALLRDVPRALIGDVPRPIKRLIPEYRDRERALRAAAMVRYGAGHKAQPALLDLWDDIALLVEWRDLKDPLLEFWGIDPSAFTGFERLRHRSPARAAAEFLARHRELLCGKGAPGDQAARAMRCAEQALLPTGLPDLPEFVTASGRRINPLSPDPAQIDIGDIATGLARIPRFNGHTTTFYSVAEHAMFVARRSPPSMMMTGLLHDAEEYLAFDLVKPAKAGFPSYELIAKRIQAAIVAAVAPDALAVKPPAVAKADHLSALVEQRDLLNDAGGWWRRPSRDLRRVEPIIPAGACGARSLFLEAFRDLQRGRHLGEIPWRVAS